jgi:hypothetical protein
MAAACWFETKKMLQLAEKGYNWLLGRLQEAADAQEERAHR